MTSSHHSRRMRVIVVATLTASLGACASADQLSRIGQAPPLSPITSPTSMPGYQPVSLPMPAPEPAVFNSNSLWRAGSRAFFKDQRAARVGDILTVEILVTDRAVFDNKTARSRTAGEKLGAAGAAGNAITGMLDESIVDGAVLGDLSSNTTTAGAGSVNRKEELRTRVAAVVTQVLPNGNLVIEGRQEIRVNYEVRDLIVAGVVRPEDISAGNIIDSSKIAEARISYGGRGQISDVQQPRYGQQILEAILPF
ncbi:flagellar basal body L-ring protein FlgH [Lutibaculum baratangense]|nr:flagellar basal body L-ring protein FlgH [Lutibaculum baratangense]